MPRRPAAYPPAYREQIIAFARAGRTSKTGPRAFSPICRRRAIAWVANGWRV